MHTIEPFWKWRDYYTAEEDGKSPFYGREYSEFEFTDQIYNYYIHPQWDHFGSENLYMKLLFTDYQQQSCIIELFGEWNDCIRNDIMFLKREVIDVLTAHGVNKFVLIGENVLNFFGSDNAYYEEWYEDIKEEGGWIVAVNFREHVMEDMLQEKIHHYINMNERYSDLNWRKYRPEHLVAYVDDLLLKRIA